MPVATVGAPMRRLGGPTATGAMAVAGGTAMILLAGLGRPAWSLDEAATTIVVDRPIEQVWRTWLTDPALEPFYLLMNAWALVSTQPWWLRLPSVLAAAVTAGLVVLIVARLVTPAAGIAAGSLFAVLPAITRYGQEARPYALVMLACTAAVWLWLSDRSLPGRRRLLLAVGLIVVGLLHAYALIIWPVLLVVTLLMPQNDRRRELTGLLMAGGLSLLALSPFLVLLAQRAAGDPDPDEITPLNLITEGLRLPVAVLRPWGAAATGGVVLALFAIGLVIGWRRRNGLRTLSLLAATWVLGWITTLVVLQLVSGAPGLVARYWTPALPALALGAAPLLDVALRRSWIAVVALLVLVAGLGLETQLVLRSENGHAGSGWYRLSRLLDQAPLADLPVLVKGSSVRPLLANGVALDRLPLVRDPAPEGRVLARSASDAAALRALGVDRPVVLVVTNADEQVIEPPDVDGFPGLTRELAVFSRPILLCGYYGEPLGVFVRPGTTLDRQSAAALQAALVGVDPDRVRCALPDGG